MIHHPWGQVAQPGRIPYIADLLAVPAPAGKPFGELWLGAHEAAPSAISLPTGELPLPELIRQQPAAVLGGKTLAAGFAELPFLLKILSCDEPLSIQAHPDKALAAQLHARDPEHYPDANHKPEIAIALTPFEAMCGFRPAAAIRADVLRLAPLAPFGADLPDDAQWLRAAYRRLFTVEDAVIRTAGQALVATLSAQAEPTPEEACFLKLWRFFPNDRGALSAFFLNHLDLRPGESVFLPANEPHAYVNGVIVECMANSNNVVRAGCTGKFIDREVLLDMLAYRQGPPPVTTGRKLAHGSLYEPPIPEFAVELIDLKAGDAVELGSDDLVSILLVIEGTCALRVPGQPSLTARRGSSWLWPAAVPGMALVCESEAGRLVRARPNL